MNRIRNSNIFSTVYLFGNFENFNFSTCKVLVVPVKIIRKQQFWEQTMEATRAAQKLWER